MGSAKRQSNAKRKGNPHAGNLRHDVARADLFPCHVCLCLSRRTNSCWGVDGVFIGVAFGHPLLYPGVIKVGMGEFMKIP